MWFPIILHYWSIAFYTTAPQAPSVTSVVESSGSIVVSWIPGAGRVDKYEVSALTSSGTKVVTKTVYAPAVNATLSKNLVQGRTYTVSVEAISNDVASLADTSKPITLAPKAPSVTSVVESSGSIAVSWIPGAGRVDKYEVSALTSSGTKVVTKTVDAHIDNVTLSDNLVQGETYTVSVEAISSGVSSLADTTKQITLAPQAPSLTSAKASSGSIVVSWIAGAGRVDQYEVTALTSSGIAVTKTVDARIEKATLSENLVQGQTYTISVKAISRGVSSLADTAKPMTLVPKAPSSTTAKKSSGSIAVSCAAEAGQVDTYVVSAQLASGKGVTKTPEEAATLSEIHTMRKFCVKNASSDTLPTTAKTSESTPKPKDQSTFKPRRPKKSTARRARFKTFNQGEDTKLIVGPALFEFRTAMATVCASRCSTTPACTMFNYNASSYQCRGYNGKTVQEFQDNPSWGIWRVGY